MVFSHHETGKDRVHRLDFAEAPTAVGAAAALRQDRQRLHVAPLDFSRRRQFFKF